MNAKIDNNIVSIIMPAYNAEQYIEESIKSVLNQTYFFWELLIVNDCSKDRTVDIIKKYTTQDQRIRLIQLKINSGVAKARNEGIGAARGRYIAFLDSDDIWLPQKLERQIDFMQVSKAAISYTQYRQFSESVKKSGDIINVEEKINYKNLLKGNIIGCLTVMIDRLYIDQIIMPEQRHEDYITWLNILKQGISSYGMKEDLARYRKNPNSLSGNKLKSLVWTWNVYRKTQNLSLLKSSYYFTHYIFKGIRKHF